MIQISPKPSSRFKIYQTSMTSSMTENFYNTNLEAKSGRMLESFKLFLYNSRNIKSKSWKAKIGRLVLENCWISHSEMFLLNWLTCEIEHRLALIKNANFVWQIFRELCPLQSREIQLISSKKHFQHNIYLHMTKQVNIPLSLEYLQCL